MMDETKARKRVHIQVRSQELKLLEMLRETFGLTPSASMRAGLRALAEKLGVK